MKESLVSIIKEYSGITGSERSKKYGRGFDERHQTESCKFFKTFDISGKDSDTVSDIDILVILERGRNGISWNTIEPICHVRQIFDRREYTEISLFLRNMQG
jgi:hypothetical protein